MDKMTDIVYTPLTPEEKAKQNWISKAYYWFWHDVCNRPEPFTYTMRRSAQDHSVYWIVTPVALVIAAAVLFSVFGVWSWHIAYTKKKKTTIIISVFVVILIAWHLLAVHLWGIW
jgi:hypothetical protein